MTSMPVHQLPNGDSANAATLLLLSIIPVIRAVVSLKCIVLALILMLFLAVGCARTGELRTENRSVELEGAELVRTDLSMNTGNMVVAGGADNLMDATFTYNVARWRPEVSYEVGGEEGQLTVEQPDLPGPTFGDVRNDWEVRFNDRVPIDLSVANSSGDLGLRDPSLRSLYIEASSGDIAAELNGDQPLLEEVEVDSSSGDVSVDLTGEYSSPMGLAVDLSSGDLLMDLTGEWEEDLDGEITLSSGTATLELPQDVGAYVEAETSSGDINASGMQLEGDAYVNRAYEESDVTLNLTVEASSGDVNLRLTG
jgi:hypothetical protein